MRLRPLIKEARPKQWIKNVLVFAAPGAAGVLTHWDNLWRTLVVFVAFCLAASGTYYWNDILDVEADRRHPKKSLRPIASGRIPMGLAKVIGSVLLVGGIGLSIVVRGWQAPTALAIYVVLTLSYSTLFRNLAVFDLVAVAGGFVLRAVGGAVASDVFMSKWFLLCTMFGSLFVVAGKRYAELRELGDGAVDTRSTMETYSLAFLRLVVTLACTATLVAYCVWAFDRGEVDPGPFPFYELSVAPMLIALLRYALVLERGHGGAPEEVFIQDRALQLMGLAWVVSFALGVYLGDGVRT
jgi:decaprenyl-phosphate phosphoribosyltransferase